MERSKSIYAAFCYGPDDMSGSWLWCEVGHRKPDPTKPFYADVVNGAWQLYYDPAGRQGIVMATKQIIMPLRLACFGHPPKDWWKNTESERDPYGYNKIIEHHLRTGEYRGIPDFFINQGDI